MATNPVGVSEPMPAPGGDSDSDSLLEHPIIPECPIMPYEQQGRLAVYAVHRKSKGVVFPSAVTVDFNEKHSSTKRPRSQHRKLSFFKRFFGIVSQHYRFLHRLAVSLRLKSLRFAVATPPEYENHKDMVETLLRGHGIREFRGFQGLFLPVRLKKPDRSIQLLVCGQLREDLESFRHNMGVPLRDGVGEAHDIEVLSMG
ncbi:hypothetical protein DL769_007138 [Monosporascus sp. CRB-8-3]|nr:hypothetical protein DL769_007138 [Monosporascus sp. CRB-8-3]